MASKTINIGGNILGGIGLGITAIDIAQNGLNYSNGFDAAFGVVSFVPGIGWIIGGLYFMGNAVSTEITGHSIGDQVGGYINTVNNEFGSMGTGLISTLDNQEGDR